MRVSSSERSPRLDKLAKIPEQYSVILHIAATVGVLVGFSLFLLLLLPAEPIPWHAWLAAPSMVILGNFVEYALHRWPMHRRKKRTDAFFKAHTLQHHKFYTSSTMEMVKPEELYYTLPSPQIIAASTTLLSGTLGLLYLVFGVQIAVIGAISLGAYGVFSEVIHVMFHFPKSWMHYPVLRSRAFQWMLRHHQLHHNPKVMTKWNFNIGLPLWDTMLGTLAPKERMKDPLA